MSAPATLHFRVGQRRPSPEWPGECTGPGALSDESASGPAVARTTVAGFGASWPAVACVRMLDQFERTQSSLLAGPDAGAGGVPNPIPKCNGS